MGCSARNHSSHVGDDQMTQQAINDLHAKIDQLAETVRVGNGALSNKIDALPNVDQVKLMVINGIAAAQLPTESRVEVLINSAQQKNEASFRTTRNWAIGLIAGVVMAVVAFGYSAGQRLATLEARATVNGVAASDPRSEDLGQIKSQLAEIEKSLKTGNH